MASTEELLRAFYEAALSADEVGLTKVLAEQAQWSVGNGSSLDIYRSAPEIVDYFRAWRAASSGTLSPFAVGSADVLIGAHHSAVVDCIIANKGGRRIRSHQVWVVSVADGLVQSGYQYIFDNAEFQAFWS